MIAERLLRDFLEFPPLKKSQEYNPTHRKGRVWREGKWMSGYKDKDPSVSIRHLDFG